MPPFFSYTSFTSSSSGVCPLLLLIASVPSSGFLCVLCKSFRCSYSSGLRNFGLPPTVALFLYLIYFLYFLFLLCFFCFLYLLLC